MSFRFVHTADVHLDSPLLTLALKDEELAGVVANATRTAFVSTIDLCLDEAVDALLIAGDLYDGELRSMKTAAFFSSSMRRLTDAGIRVFIVRGNHDAESRITTKHLALPEGVHVFTSHGQSVVLEEAGVAVHGVSFAKPQAPDSLLAKYKPPVDDLINVGLLHTSLAGSAQHDTYSPCSVQDLKDQGYDYWALGHIHKREVHADSPQAIVMPGIPQGRHINEPGAGSVTLVEIDDNRAIRLEERYTSTVQFERVTVDVTGVSDWQQLPALLEAELGKVMATVRAEHLIARVTLKGVSVLASRLRRDRDVLLEEVRNAARRVGSVLVEDAVVEVTPEPPKTDYAAIAADPIEELRRIVAESAGQRSPAMAPVLAEALELVAQLQQALPPEIRDALGATDDELLASVELAAQEGAAEVLARLEVVGSGG